MEVGSATEALKVLRRGSKQRQRAETGLNYSSSRSHSIFTVRAELLLKGAGCSCQGEQHEQVQTLLPCCLLMTC